MVNTGRERDLLCERHQILTKRRLNKECIWIKTYPLRKVWVMWQYAWARSSIYIFSNDICVCIYKLKPKLQFLFMHAEVILFHFHTHDSLFSYSHKCKKPYRETWEAHFSVPYICRCRRVGMKRECHSKKFGMESMDSIEEVKIRRGCHNRFIKMVKTRLLRYVNSYMSKVQLNWGLDRTST